MKISFSTLGCPDYSWTDIYTMAKDLGYHGIEIRGLGNDILATRAKPFSEEQLPKTVAKLREIGIEVSCLSSGIALKYQAKLPKIMDELTSYAKLANALGTAYIRVLADEHPAPEGEVDDEAIIATLKQLVPIAEQYNVTMLVETNGVYSDTTRLKKILDAVGSRKIAALWDIHHPYRNFGETPEQTVATLGEYIKYVHVKDSVFRDGKVSYRLMGDGDMPLKEAFAALQSMHYTGSKTPYMLWKYMLPNTITTLVITAATDIGGMMMELAALSFLGFGAQPPTPEWGQMLNEGRNFMQSAPWLMIYPGLAIFITVVVFNMLGDGLRDILDPRNE